MLHARVFGGLHSPGDAVTGAVGFVAEERSAADDAFARQRLIRIMAGGRAAGVEGARSGKFLVVRVLIVVGAPFPDVAGHVDEAISIGGEAADRRSIVEAIGGGIFVRE